MTLVKICGNRTPGDVLAAADAGIDFVGLVFAESKRRVDAAAGRRAVAALGDPLEAAALSEPPSDGERRDIARWFEHGAHTIAGYLDEKRPLTVGVFADQPIDEVNAIAAEARVDIVQLSGDETWEDCLRVERPVIQVVHVSPIDSPSDPMEFVQPGFALALMLDAAHGPHRGGSGRTFDWEVAIRVSERIPMMLAGGLTPENVGEAVERVRPWAVDVSSGTETEGRKDHGRVRAFVQAVRAADEAAATAPRGRIGA
jgi:phosphoribosylanthranilate isomerase